jgi:hypothetical protein
MKKLTLHESYANSTPTSLPMRHEHDAHNIDKLCALAEKKTPKLLWEE